jgi:hypothetical protein
MNWPASTGRIEVMRTVLHLLALLLVPAMQAQVPVPFNSTEGRFMAHSQGRFEKLAPRPPQAVFPMEGQLAFVDHAGELRLFIAEKRRLVRLDAGGIGTIKAAGDRLAWTRGDSLHVLRGDRAVFVSSGVHAFTVSDSLVVYHDSVAQELNVLWRNQVFPLASIERSSGRPQWSQGSNTVCFLDRTSLRLLLFHRGQVQVLCDSTGVGIVAPGSDMVGFWDEHAGEFRVWEPKGITRLADQRPRSATAGKGLLAFVDAHGRLRCHDGQGLHTLTDTMPTAYWVRDSLLLYVKAGQLMLYDGRAALKVERYIPEQWEVQGGSLVYLDINRELHALEGGLRKRLGREAGIPRFELYGDAVLYTSPSGPVTVLRGKRSYLF